jgi:hypothetical protein
MLFRVQDVIQEMCSVWEYRTSVLYGVKDSCAVAGSGHFARRHFSLRFVCKFKMDKTIVSCTVLDRSATLYMPIKDEIKLLKLKYQKDSM